MTLGDENMSSFEPASALFEHVGPLTHVLDETLAQAIRAADDQLARYDHQRFSFLRPMAVRLEMRLTLESSALPEGWEVAGDPRRMGQLILAKPGILELRLLKGNPLQPGLVPPAGHNAARREYWTNPPLFEWPAASVQADPFKFLLIWNYLDPTSRLEGFTLHIAHPLSPGNYGSCVPCDLVEAVPRGGTFFEELRPFRHDEDEDLFIQVADEEQQ